MKLITKDMTMAGFVAAFLLISGSASAAPALTGSSGVQAYSTPVAATAQTNTQACRQAESHSMAQEGMRHVDNCQASYSQSTHPMMQIRMQGRLPQAEKQACEEAKLHSVPQEGMHHPGVC